MRIVSLSAAIGIAALIVGDPAASSVSVPPDGDLQEALNRARPGDAILLTAGATYVGNFVLPARGDGDPITVRTAGNDGLPADGERITPAASGKLARIQSPNGSPALRTSPGTHDWIIQFLEFGPNHGGSGDIIDLGDGSTAQNALEQVPANITIDRVYIHGDPTAGQKRGIGLNSRSTRIAGSYISDIKAIGQDSQAIAGWNGPGDYVIENNYLEAAGENIMFGGADPAILNLTPTRIVVRNNYMTKPLAWHDQRSPAWQVKNIFELKNARTVLVEHNLLEHSWQQAQTGYAVLFTVRNQNGGCGWCQVEDVQFRANVVRDVAAGIQILGTDSNYPSRQTNRIFVADNLFERIDKDAWGGDGYFLQLSDAPRDVTIDHNTIAQGASNGLIKIAQGVTDAFKLTNNVALHGAYGIIGTDHGVGNDSIRTYLPGAQITNNVIAGADGGAYPPGNLFPSVDDFKQQFVNFAQGDFRLKPNGRWAGAATDGRDLGANVADLAGVLTAQTKKGGLKQPARRVR